METEPILDRFISENKRPENAARLLEAANARDFAIAEAMKNGADVNEISRISELPDEAFLAQPDKIVDFPGATTKKSVASEEDPVSSRGRTGKHQGE